MFDSVGNVKFIDFGFSVVIKRAHEDLNRVGTPYYMAPEIFD